MLIVESVCTTGRVIGILLNERGVKTAGKCYFTCRLTLFSDAERTKNTT